MKSLPFAQLRWFPLGAGAALLLAACGGGGGTDAGSGGGTAVKTTITGTAATGAALAGATVSIKCVVGTGTVTAGGDGVYTLSLTDATLPCVAKATSTDGKTVLHAVVNPGGGTTQTVNINPLTELVAARVAGGEATALFNTFDTAAAAKVSASSISNAVDAVVATLKAGGVDFSAVGNPMTAALVAKTASTSGNAYDQALDLLGSQLTSAGTTLAQLASAVAAPAAGSSATVLPSQLLQPGHPSCAALRSGTYRWLSPDESDPAWRTSKVQINAVTSTLTWHNGSTSVATPVGGCAFTADGGKARIVVSPAGVMVATSVDNNGKQTVGVGFPEQAAQLSDLAGTWNVIEFNNINGQSTIAAPSYVNDFTVAELAADGKHLSLAQCEGVAACVPQPGPFGTFVVDPAGGFNYVEPAGVPTSGARFFVLRSASGDLTLLGVGNDGSIVVGTKQAARALPTVGSFTQRWDLTVNPSGLASPFSEAAYTVTGVDSAAQTYSRTTQSNGVVNVFANNKPRNGHLYRAPGTATTNTGSTVAVSELISLPLPGTGVIVYGRVTTEANRSAGFFGVGVVKPEGASGTTNWPVAAAAANTFVYVGGEAYPLRARFSIGNSGSIVSGQYDWHKIAGTMTPCEYTPDNAATCMGTNAVFGQVAQSGPITLAGSATPITLSTAPDLFGFAFTGTLTGVRWTGTWSKIATASSPGALAGGAFSVDLTITAQ